MIREVCTTTELHGCDWNISHFLLSFLPPLIFAAQQQGKVKENPKEEPQSNGDP